MIAASKLSSRENDEDVEPRTKKMQVRNGESLTNGHSTESQREEIIKTAQSGFDIRKTDLLRIMSQALRDFGHSNCAEMLEADSGIRERSPAISELEETLRQGKWASAIHQIESLFETCKSAEADTEHGLENWLRVKDKCKLVIYQEVFLERLDENDTTGALACLRGELGPLCSTDQLAQFSSLLILSPQSIREMLERSENASENRDWVVEKVNELLPSTLALPKQRLLTLLDFSIQHQMKSCLFNGFAKRGQTFVPLLENLDKVSESKSLLPSRTIQVLDDPCGPNIRIHALELSDCGSYLVAAGGHCVSWIAINAPSSSTQLPSCNLLFQSTSDHHQGEVNALSWSPSGEFTVSADHTGGILIWKGLESRWQKPSIKKRINTSKGCPTTALVWTGKDTFAAGRTDGCISLFNMSGTLLTFIFADSVYSLSYLPALKTLVVVGSSQSRVRFFTLRQRPSNSNSCLAEREEQLAVDPPLVTKQNSDLQTENCGLEDSNMFWFEEWKRNRKDFFNVTKPVTAVAAARSSRSIVLSVLNENLIEWDVQTGQPLTVYGGLVQGRGVFRPSFGGYNQNFLGCGGIDARICIWERGDSQTVKSVDSDTGGRLPAVVLEGHTRPTNCICWSPVDPSLLISASDDASIRIWYS